jgi:hypothetical protein
MRKRCCRSALESVRLVVQVLSLVVNVLDYFQD